MSKYETPKAGEWVQPIRKGYKLACCDCCLVHRMEFRVRNGRAQFKAYRDNRATASMRAGRTRSVRAAERKEAGQ